MKEERTIEYLLPKRIIASEKCKNAEVLLENCDCLQIFPNDTKICACSGYILLDFGRELCGGIRLTAHFTDGDDSPIYARIRFGESVGEACAELGDRYAGNDHSPRDFNIPVSMLSDVRFGDTGFRFVRIDCLTEGKEIKIKKVLAVSNYLDLEYKGAFECDDKLLNDIYDVARYTVHLNMQTNLWDGVKRDRLVWVGDMQPEVLAITCVFGENKCVENTLLRAIKQYPLPCWINNIATYSVWLLQVLYDYYLKVGNDEFIKPFLPYVYGVLNQLDKSVTEDGDIIYENCGVKSPIGYFIDWPTKGLSETKDGVRFLYVFILNNFAELLNQLGENNDICYSIVKKLKKTHGQVYKKQLVSCGLLADMISKKEAAEKLANGGAKGLSTFMSYFILRALFESGEKEVALDILKEYYGAMLMRGATTFWEDFDVEWLENSGRIDEPTPEGFKDLHGDFGAYCYQGFRHSLCHGWSCGPVQFLTEYVLGVKVAQKGCKKIIIKPYLGKLNFVKGKFPTPYGVVEILHEKVNGKIYTKVNAPKEVSYEVIGV